MASTRDRALLEAATVLADEGYPSLTLERVASAVGVKAASLYHHFASRDVLVAEAMQRGADAVAQALHEALAAIPTDQPLRRLEAAVRTHLAAVADHAPFTTANLLNIEQLPAELRETVVPHNRRLVAQWDELFQALAEAEAFPAHVDVPALRQLVLSALNDTSALRRGASPVTPDQLAAQLIALLRGAAGGPSGRPSGAVDVRIEQHIGWIELHAPPVNALTPEVVADLASALEAVTRSTARVAIVTSAVPGEFCGGADLALLRQLDPSGFESYLLGLRAVFDRIAEAPFPTIAAIDGPAMGCGLELAIACTFRVVAPEARLGLPEITMGLSPGAGTTERLPRLVGRQAALDLVLTGRAVHSDEAHRIGLVDRLVDDPATAAHEWARELARSPRAGLDAAIHSVNGSSDRRAELRDAITLFASPEGSEGIEAHAAAITGEHTKQTPR